MLSAVYSPNLLTMTRVSQSDGFIKKISARLWEKTPIDFWKDTFGVQKYEWIGLPIGDYHVCCDTVIGVIVWLIKCNLCAHALRYHLCSSLSVLHLYCNMIVCLDQINTAFEVKVAGHF